MNLKNNNNNNISNLKLNIGSEQLYFDVDELMSNVEISGTTGGQPIVEINLPRFEFFKLMLDTTCGIIEEIDDNLGVISLNKMSVPYKLALNTLINYKIIKKL